MKNIILLTMFVQIFMVMGQLPQPRVLGGYPAAENQFPFQISLQRDEKHICGGAILTKSFVLTAGVCVTRKDRQLQSPIDYEVVAGSTSAGIGGEHYRLHKFIIHENCCKQDIALLKLKKPFMFNENVQAIPIYGRELHENDVVTAIGWGATDKTEVLSEKLKFHYLVVNSAQDCKKYNPDRFYDGLLCLSHAVHNGPCIGDIGGPAIFQGKLVGIASFILTACGSDKPDGYMKVSYFLEWINSKLY